jgi:hypothetical protein
MAKHINRSKEIMDVFKIHGGQMSPRETVEHCLRAGVWTEEEQHNAMFSGLRREVINTLKQKDDHGLPFAIVTAQRSGTTRVWAQLGLADLDDCLSKLAHDIQGNYHDYTANLHFRDYIEEKFDVDIPMPDFSLEAAEEWMKKYLDAADNPNDDDPTT